MHFDTVLLTTETEADRSGSRLIYAYYENMFTSMFTVSSVVFTFLAVLIFSLMFIPIVALHLNLERILIGFGQEQAISRCCNLILNFQSLPKFNLFLILI